MTETPRPSLAAWPPDEALSATVTDIMEANEVPGAIVRLSAPGLAPWTHAFGLANIETGAPMQATMHGRIGSITKTMVATLVLQLVDAGAIALDDTLASLLPSAAGLPNADTIALRDLLTMRSGLYNFTEQEGVFDTIIDNPTRCWGPDELIAIAAAHPANFAPGTRYEYSNTNYILLGEIVGAVTGTPVDRAFRERLAEPFGLGSTTWPTGPAIPAPFADGYARMPLEGAVTASSSLDGPTRMMLATEIDASAAGAAGAVISTVEDMDRWIDILLDGKALSPATSRAQLDVLPVPNPDGEPSGIGYGMGVADFGGIVGHNGGIPGFQSFAGRIVDLHVNVSVIINVDSGVHGGQPADAIAIALRRFLSGETSSDPLS